MNVFISPSYGAPVWRRRAFPVDFAAVPHVLPIAIFRETAAIQKCKGCLILLVGAARFELATPSPPDWCANRAALRSETVSDYSDWPFCSQHALAIGNGAT